VQVCTWRAGDIERFSDIVGSRPVPSGDGRIVFTEGGRYSTQLKPATNQQAGCLPAAQGAYYFNMTDLRAGLGLRVYQEGKAGTVSVRKDIDGIGPADRGVNGLAPDRRAFLVPEARLLIIIPESKDRLILHRITI
jgi:hypothetical protein